MNAPSLIIREVKRLSIGSNVKKYRLARKLSQRELALLAGISNSTVSDIERDAKPPSMKVLSKLAKALRCTEADLLKN